MHIEKIFNDWSCSVKFWHFQISFGIKNEEEEGRNKHLSTERPHACGVELFCERGWRLICPIVKQIWILSFKHCVYIVSSIYKHNSSPLGPTRAFVSSLNRASCLRRLTFICVSQFPRFQTNDTGSKWSPSKCWIFLVHSDTELSTPQSQKAERWFGPSSNENSSLNPAAYEDATSNGG